MSKLKMQLTKQIKVGNVKIGGGAPVSIQSMVKSLIEDTDGVIEEIRELEKEGCDIVRIALPTKESVKYLKKIKTVTQLPLVADVHFDYRIALEAIKQGVDKIRINPGNIGGKERLKTVVKLAKERNIPMRIGVNSGSVEKDIEKKYGQTPRALTESVRRNVEILEDMDFTDIVISAKSSSTLFTIETYRRLRELFPYPLHIGVTEAGLPFEGTIKSAVGIGSLLSDGIGDTIRVSLTAPSVEEVRVAKEILFALGLKKRNFEIISCPTCGRCSVDVETLARELKERLLELKDEGLPRLKIAVMGCLVNGPGEARDADFGITGGKGKGIIFRRGEVLKTVKEDELLDTLINEILLLKKKSPPCLPVPTDPYGQAGKTLRYQDFRL
ncbi:4-hydroxy-3-methylbut-2-en-1-yl diphosphate synthase [candidate division WOR-3 bacterium JGI_Cruoil_03_44_89]|uniref:4-hydroxy-3-methylbut-2-en-1-yl diphosphate synthase (flavodoxin) n=1 Tax=candidate division WOR-3 bacterium JGI_Cruoil_03_44_89 TaxID=1973748 RepID=A0A235BYV2_UNCW3|nr:MAG: 4-hydroxy-3-methylbut-2-en-1-yl diphosphate synthase [candidate division WOR-3 bacterium JGI_Cruoil_03_44_89]